MLHGVDLSTYQRDVNYAALGYAIDFAFVKACDRSSIAPEAWAEDPLLATHAEGLFDFAVPYGLYCFGHPSANVDACADFFLTAIGGWNAKLRPVIDLETLSRDEHGTQVVPSNVGAWALAWLERVRAAGHRPMAYAGKYYWAECVRQCPQLADVDLWLAEYFAHCPPAMPPGRPERTIALQWTGTGRVDGVHGDADLDVVYASDLSALLA